MAINKHLKDQKEAFVRRKLDLQEQGIVNSVSDADKKIEIIDYDSPKTHSQLLETLELLDQRHKEASRALEDAGEAFKKDREEAPYIAAFNEKTNAFKRLASVKESINSNNEKLDSFRSQSDHELNVKLTKVIAHLWLAQKAYYSADSVSEIASLKERVIALEKDVFLLQKVIEEKQQEAKEKPVVEEYVADNVAVNPEWDPEDLANYNRTKQELAVLEEKWLDKGLALALEEIHSDNQRPYDQRESDLSELAAMKKSMGHLEMEKNVYLGSLEDHPDMDNPFFYVRDILQADESLVYNAKKSLVNAYQVYKESESKREPNLERVKKNYESAVNAYQDSVVAVRSHSPKDENQSELWGKINADYQNLKYHEARRDMYQEGSEEYHQFNKMCVSLKDSHDNFLQKALKADKVSLPQMKKHAYQISQKGNSLLRALEAGEKKRYKAVHNALGEAIKKAKHTPILTKKRAQADRQVRRLKKALKEMDKQHSHKAWFPELKRELTLKRRPKVAKPPKAKRIFDRSNRDAVLKETLLDSDSTNTPKI